MTTPRLVLVLILLLILSVVSMFAISALRAAL